MSTLSSSSSSGTQRELADLPPGSTTPITHEAATADFRIAQWKPIAFFALLIQLVGLCCVIHRYEIETNAFATLMDLSLVGFAIHYFLPQRLKMPFFLLLSLAAIVVILGLTQGLWLIGLGLALIGLAHLPTTVRVRVAVLLLAACALSVLRSGIVALPWSSAIWPILGSMFMFRMIGYLYDVSHGQGQATIWQRISYFFLLPNVCFPLFPVVDFRTFVRTYSGTPNQEGYQRGLDWILRGIIQLLLYRFIHRWLVITPEEVATGRDFLHYCLWLYFLYLRVSGQFHIIVGMLHLFGCNLPETHRQYYLASSFTDFWRRINIYWKDFMMKVFYYPIFFRLKRLGPLKALVASTIAVFVLTWALHAYQWFWIRGTYLLTWNDVLFWTLLCVLVVVNSLWEAKYGRKRTVGTQGPGWKRELVACVKTVLVFTSMCLIWSFWSSESVAEWLSLFSTMTVSDARGETLLLLLGIAAVIVLARAYVYLASHRFTALAGHGNPFTRGLIVIGWLFALNVLSISAVNQRLGAVGQVIASTRSAGLNRAEKEQLERGYYEDLLTVDRFNSELGELYSKRPLDPNITATSTKQLGNGIRYELVPNLDAHFNNGVRFQTNRWGMHDRDYELVPAANVYRIAVLGTSHAMGQGVPMTATFENLLENKLNAENAIEGGRFEILNCAASGYLAVDQPSVLAHKAIRFKPRTVIFVGHPNDVRRSLRHISQCVKKSESLGHAYLDALVQKVGVDATTSERVIMQRLEPRGDELLSWVHHEIVELCKQHDIQPICLYLPMIPEVGTLREKDKAAATNYMAIAKSAGFIVLDLSDVYVGQRGRSLWNAEWDDHPNEAGHRLIADRLFDSLKSQEASLLNLNAIP